MKRISEYNTHNATDQQPCDLIVAYKMHELQNGNMISFLQQFEYEDISEMEEDIKTFCNTVVLDPFMTSKSRQKDALLDLVYKRYYKIMSDPGKSYSYPHILAEEIWNSGYWRKRLEANVNDLFSIEPDPEVFKQTRDIIQKEYQLTDHDMEKLHFFVEQCKAGADFPNSHRRMLYIWGSAKKTGKTTVASCIVEILNGDMNPYHNAKNYRTKLAEEMQIGEFKIPLRSQCNVCLMDECFYRDMGKTYSDFKQMLTSSGGTARRPFGQPFRWEGWPNYVATSNDPLRNFITDWDDRRYLSIEFKKKPVKNVTDFDTIKALWAQYIVNSTPKKEWSAWAQEMSDIADECGERSARMEEYANELKQSRFIALIQQLVDGGNNDRLFLKFFVDFFAGSMGNTEAHRRREEIEQAVINVYGNRYSTTNYWRLQDIKKKADSFDLENRGFVPVEPDALVGDDNDELDF